MGGGSTAEGSMSGSSLGHAREESTEGESGDVGEGVKVWEDGEKEDGEEQVVITLSETETITLLAIPGTVVADPGQQEAVRGSNLAYQEVCVPPHALL